MDQQFWTHAIGAIATHAWARQTGPWALPSLFYGLSPRQIEKALFKNEIAHARVKLRAREQALTRATIKARESKLDGRQARLDKMQESLKRTRDNAAKIEAERAEKARTEREKRARLDAQRIAMNGASRSGTATAYNRLYSVIKR